MRRYFDLHPHGILAQLYHPNTSPNRFVIRHPFLEVPHHSAQRLIIHGDVVRVYAEYLRPPLPPSIL